MRFSSKSEKMNEPDVSTRESRRRARRSVRSDAKDRWMITYADLITLLLIFFVMMYAMSRLDVEKYEVVTSSLQHTFKGGDSILELGSGITGTADRYTHKNPPASAENGSKQGEG